MRSSITISDIATRAGCSKSTVARVLNQRPDVNPETRARILAIMEELAFVPDERARALASGRSATLGLMVANLTSPYSHDMIRAFENEARRAGFAVILLDTSYDPAEEGWAIDFLWRKRVDGVAVVPVGESSTHVRRLVSLGVPTVLVARYFSDIAVDSVHHDNRRTGYLAVHHLLGLGHRRILYLNRDAAISTVADRLAGVHEALAEAGLPESTVTVVPAEAAAVGGYTAIRKICADAPGHFSYSAVLAYNDMVALGSQRALHEAGYAVPRDLSLMACSDSGVCDFLPVRLTAVRDDWGDVGQQAFAVLHDRLAHPGGPSRQLVLPTTLIVRDSTAPIFALSPSHSPGTFPEAVP